MSASATTAIAISISIICEECGRNYGYDRKLKRSATSITPNGALAIARKSLTDAVNTIENGDYSLIVSNKPCPECGYVQSWMIEPIGRRRGFRWGAGLALFSFVFSYNMAVWLNMILPNSYRLLKLITFLGIPVIVFFVSHALIIKLYQPNKNHQVPSQSNLPSIKYSTPSSIY